MIPADMLTRMTTFGDLLSCLRRLGITQTDLSIAVGYCDAQISRLAAVIVWLISATGGSVPLSPEPRVAQQSATP